MKKALTLTSLLALWAGTNSAWAAEQTVTLAVDNMYCALCPITVTKAIEKVEGVRDVKANFDTKEAVVTYEDSIANLDTIAAASTNAGYPAHVK